MKHFSKALASIAVLLFALTVIACGDPNSAGGSNSVSDSFAGTVWQQNLGTTGQSTVQGMTIEFAATGNTVTFTTKVTSISQTQTFNYTAENSTTASIYYDYGGTKVDGYTFTIDSSDPDTANLYYQTTGTAIEFVRQ